MLTKWSLILFTCSRYCPQKLWFLGFRVALQLIEIVMGLKRHSVKKEHLKIHCSHYEHLEYGQVLVVLDH